MRTVSLRLGRELFDPHERAVFKKLSSPPHIQDFLEEIPINFEEKRDTCMSPRMVLRTRRAHCMEGAMLAAAALRFHGRPPLVLDLTAAHHDFDHVVALFKENGLWGAISKTNHAVLRYREPVYKTIRELAMSYFHEYFTDSGEKTLRSYSRPVNLSQFDSRGWMTSEKDVWYIPNFLAKIPHMQIASRRQISHFRKADPIEIAAGKLIVTRSNRSSR